MSQRSRTVRCSGEKSLRRKSFLERLESRELLAADLSLPGATDALIAEGEIRAEGESTPLFDLADFAQAMTDAGVKFFGSSLCPVCSRQKALFGDAAELLPYIEVTNPDGSLNQVGIDNNITSYPTWEFQDGSRQIGFLDLGALGEGSNIPTPTNVVTLETNYGDIEMILLPQNAPNTVDNFLNYANDDGYDNAIFHRLVSGFVLQGGGFETTDETFTDVSQLTAIPTDPPVVNEFDRSNVRGTVAMAKLGGDPDSATNQFFFNLANNALNLDNQNGGFTVFAEVPDMAVVDSLAQSQIVNIDNGVFSATPMRDSDQLLVIRDVLGSGEVSGVIFQDLDRDGQRDPGEAGIADLVVYLDANANNMLDAGERSATTDANGAYSIVAEAGDHILRYDLQDHQISTTGINANHDITLEIGRSTVANLGRFDIPNVAVIELAAAYDTGISDTDNLTRFDNSDLSNVLEFVISGAESGALVKLFAGDQFLGQALANSDATILTSGDVPLTGEVTLTAFQEVNGVAGPQDTSLNIQVDTTPPTFTTQPPTIGKAAVEFTYDADTDEDGSGTTYALQAAPLGAEIESATGLLTWTPTAAQVGNQTFAVIAEDSAGNQTSQSLDIEVLSNEQLIIRLSVTDLAGTPITEINQGEEFLVKGFVSDNRIAPEGVAAAYFDLLYQNRRALPTGEINFGADFGAMQSGDIDALGVVDELGAGGNTTNVGDAELPLFEARFIANIPGEELFDGDGADVLPDHDSFLLGDPNPASPDVIKIEGATLNILATFGANGDEFPDVDEDSVDVSLDVLANDILFEGSTGELTISSVDPSAEGATINIAADSKSLLYTPPANFFGVDTFTYTATDGTSTDSATVIVLIAGINDPPEAVEDTFSATEDDGETLLDVLFNDSIAPDEGETLTIVSVGNPDLGGTVRIGGAGSHLFYSPLENANGPETFTYTIQDNGGLQATGTVTVNIAPTNDPPRAISDSFTLQEDDPATVFDPLANDSDAPDSGETLTIIEVTQPANNVGVVRIVNNGTEIEFEPAPNVNGSFTATYTISDGNGGEATNQLRFIIASVNDPPAPENDTFTITKNTGPHTILVTDNDSIAPDIEETLRVTAVTGASNGVASVHTDEQSIVYTPDQDFSGEEILTYTVTDSGGATATATLTITVRDFEPSSISGFVYVDLNGSGTRNFGETPLAGITISLVGRDDFGGVVSETTTTDASGQYRFETLAPGAYAIQQDHPESMNDGPEQLGSQGGSIDGNDVMSLTLPEGVEAESYNFGEAGRAVGFVRLKDFFLNSEPPQAEIHEEDGNTLFYALGPGWNGYQSIQISSFNNGQDEAVLLVVDNSGTQSTVVLPHSMLESRQSGDEIARRILASAGELGLSTPTGEGLEPEAEAEGRLAASPWQATATVDVVAEGESVVGTSAILNSTVAQATNARQHAQVLRASADELAAEWILLESRTQADVEWANHTDETSQDYEQSLDEILGDEDLDGITTWLD